MDHAGQCNRSDPKKKDFARLIAIKKATEPQSHKGHKGVIGRWNRA